MFLTILIYLLGSLGIIGLLACSISIWKLNYWRKLGVRGPRPKLFIGNNSYQFKHKRHHAYNIQEIYECYKNTDNYVGIFNCNEPQLLITNAELVGRIFVSDFKHFHDNFASFMTDANDLLLGSNPFVLTGDSWKEKRSEVTPGLTITRLKSMYPITQKACKLMLDYIEKQIRISAERGIDAKNLAARLMCEIVSDCAFGLDVRSFGEEPQELMQMVQNVIENLFYVNTNPLSVLLTLTPGLTTLLKKLLVPQQAGDYLIKFTLDAIEMRKSQIKQNINTDRIDFLNYLIQIQQKKNLTNNELVTHAMTFLFDGYETTSTVLSHCLLLLGRDENRQKVLFEEIQKNLGSEYSFEEILELPYLDACIHETIRIFTPALSSHKICTEPIELTNRNGDTLMVPKGMIAVLPVHAIMHDESFYEKAESFVPERFLPENGGLKKYKDMDVYYGFGDGPRACLGMRFALSQIKTALIEILRRYRLTVTEETCKNNNLDPNYFMSRIIGGIWLEFIPRY